MVNIKITNNNNARLEFTLSGVDVAFANMIRRIMISEIPILAIEFVEIKHNTCYKSDTLAHIIGLCPIESSSSSLLMHCKHCQSFCEKCSIPLILEVKNDTDTLLKVTSSDFQSEVIIRPKIPIMKLKKGEFVNIKAYARKNIGKKHAKWQSVSVASYNYSKPHATKFEFFIEPTGALSSHEILKRSFEILRDKAQSCINKL